MSEHWHFTSVFPGYDLTRHSIGRTVFHGDLFVLAVAGDDKFVLFRDRTLKNRGTFQSWPTNTLRRTNKKTFKNCASKLTLAFAPCWLLDVSPIPSHIFFFCITSPGFRSWNKHNSRHDFRKRWLGLPVKNSIGASQERKDFRVN